MIKVVLAVTRPAKAVPTLPVNEIRYYNFTIIQTASYNAAVLVTDDINKHNNPYHKYLIENQK